MKKKKIMALPYHRVLIAVAVLTLIGSTQLVASYDPKKEFTVFGYLPEYRLGGFNYDAAFDTGLTHLIFFSLEIDPVTGLPSALDRLPSKEQAAQARRAADRNGGKILLSFGGNSRSQGFPTAAKTKKSRRKFLRAVNALLLEYQFDGVDYNWEYPRNDQEWRNWAFMLKESKDLFLRTKEIEQSIESMNEKQRDAFFSKRPNHDNNIVTFTMYLDPRHYDVIMKYKLLEHADYVHCMAYDQHGPHSTYDFAESGIELAEKKGFQLQKFTLGLPFYGRHIDNGEPKTWYEFADKFKGKGENVDALESYYFNNKATIRKKTKLAIDRKIGGVMIWEIGQDKQPMNHPDALMPALNEVAGPHLWKNNAGKERKSSQAGGSPKEDSKGGDL